MLKSDLIANKQSMPSVVLSYLNTIQDNIEALYTQSQAYSKYTEQLSIERFDFEKVFEVHKDFQIKYDMWNAIK